MLASCSRVCESRSPRGGSRCWASSSSRLCRLQSRLASYRRERGSRHCLCLSAHSAAIGLRSGPVRDRLRHPPPQRQESNREDPARRTHLSGYQTRPFDMTRCCGDDRLMTERMEAAVRMAVAHGARLRTPTGRGQFSVAQYTHDGLVLLLGDKEARTPLPWKALDEVPNFLRGRGWVDIGMTYSTESTQERWTLTSRGT